MRDLLDYEQRRVKFVEPLWWYYTKEFLRGFFKALGVVLMALMMLIEFYLLAWFLLDDRKEFDKKVESNSRYEKAYSVSNE